MLKYNTYIKEKLNLGYVIKRFVNVKVTLTILEN